MKRKKVRGVRVDVNREVKLFFFWGGGGGQGGCELRSEAFVKIQKNRVGGSGWM